MKVASFDLNGSLANTLDDQILWYSGIPKAIAKKKGISKHDALRECLDAYDSMGPTDPRWYSPDYWLKRFGIEEDREELFAGLLPFLHVYPDTLPCLDALKGQGVPCVIVSSSSLELLEYRLEALNLRKYFSLLFSVTSSYGRLTKDRKVFSDVADKTGAKIGEIFHVGNERLSDYDIPTEAGVNAFYLDRSGKEKGEFVVRGLNEFAGILLDA